ncbi:hypothetical protein chiPu_0028565, partial [Chiloscyllium punctatum]|nr:hypothetical protein [Chiloscyllium punctatum]
MTGREASHDNRHHLPLRKTAHRLDAPRAVAVRCAPRPADPAAVVVARGVRLHRQEPSSNACEFRHAVQQSRLPRSAADHRDHRHDIGSDLLHRRGADQLAGVAHRHAGAADHPRAGDGLVRDAAVPRCGR